MLPYTPLHHLLLRDFDGPLVATSGNRSDEPLCRETREALERLPGIADLLLTHDREIARSVDDSVAQVVAGRPQVLRRARGSAPLALPLPRPAPPLLALGGHMKNSVALAVERTLVVGPHVGDLDDARSRDAFEAACDGLTRLYALRPTALACDRHPDYASTLHARASGLPCVAVQHHHAHVAAVALEHGLDEPLLGVAWDGTGMGLDGTLWGGEFLRVHGARCERAAHLRSFPLPGGEQAVHDPRRAALGLLFELLGDEAGEHVALPEPERRVLLSMLRRGVNCPRSSGVGRLFDALAALLGLCDRARYEGEPAARLEFAAEAAEASGERAYALDLRGDVLDWGPLVRALLADRAAGVPSGVIARRVHGALIEAVVAVARREALPAVALAGGCFQNRLLLEGCVQRLREEGLRVYWPEQLPPGDGGLCAGQAAVALAPPRDTQDG
jgi:hydrogenase maturation protein HypF